MSEQQGAVVEQVQKTVGKRTPQDAELAAMKKVDAILEDLSLGAQSRVLTWARSRFYDRQCEAQGVAGVPASAKAVMLAETF